MWIGGVYLFDGKPVRVYAGQYRGQSGGVSNHWRFQYIRKDGTLGREGEAYGNEIGEELIAHTQMVVTIPSLNIGPKHELAVIPARRKRTAKTASRRTGRAS